MNQDALWPAAWALACLCCVSVCIVMLWRGAPLQTDLLALLPATERNPTAERAVAALSAAAGNRVLFVIGHADAAKAKQATRRFASALRASGAFRSVTAELPPFDARLLGKLYVEHRFGLLAESDRRELASGHVDPQAWLARRLASPLRLDVAGDLALDPFGLLDRFVAELPYRRLRLTTEDGLLLIEAARADPARTRVLVSAELPGSAFDDHVQAQTVAAVESAQQQLETTSADVEILRTGAVFYAAAARAAAQQEMSMITVGSLAGITLLMFAVFRSPQPLLLGLLTIGAGLAVATAVALLVYRELHLIALVFGATLIGEAIDYPIQYFAAHADAARQWQPRRALEAIRPGLTFALATSLMGYAALVWLPFPAIGQIALFALVGLTAAYLTVVLLLPKLVRGPYRHDLRRLTGPAGRFLESWQERVSARAAFVAAAAVIAVCVPGWLQLRVDDDVRAMSSRPPELLAQESTIRSLTGIGHATELFLVEGPTAEAVLRREEALAARLRRLAERGVIAHFDAISSFVPSAARQADNRALVQGSLLLDGGRLERIFADVGFRPGVAAGLVMAWRAAGERTMRFEHWLAAPASMPYRHLWLGQTSGGYASIVLPFGHASAAPLAAVASGLDGVMLVDKVGAVNRLFDVYRTGFSVGLALAIAITFLVLSVRYGRRGAAALVLPALLGIGVALGASGYAGVPVSLFTVMAFILVLGVGSNYAIFLVEGSGRKGITLIAVALSAITTLLAFGLLAASGTPALARFGTTLTLGIGTAVVMAPLALALCRVGHMTPTGPGE